jgi:hypothetical protein
MGVFPVLPKTKKDQVQVSFLSFQKPTKTRTMCLFYSAIIILQTERYVLFLLNTTANSAMCSVLPGYNHDV